MTSTYATFALAVLAITTSTANAATITLEGVTTPIEYNGVVQVAPEPIASGVGNTVATGLTWTGGEGFGEGIEEQFLAWCFDLIHPVSLGGTYEYEIVDAPYSNSYLLSGADARVSRLFDTSYDNLDASDPVQAAAFQLAVWEVANDNDFDITTGVFQASGLGSNAANITSTAQTFLSASVDFTGPSSWRTIFLETREDVGSQNLVTAIRKNEVAAVPLPAGGILLLSGLVGTGAFKRKKFLVA